MRGLLLFGPLRFLTFPSGEIQSRRLSLVARGCHFPRQKKGISVPFSPQRRPGQTGQGSEAAGAGAAAAAGREDGAAGAAHHGHGAAGRRGRAQPPDAGGHAQHPTVQVLVLAEEEKTQI